MTRNNSILLGALLGLLAADLAGATTLRYIGSGDYNDLYTVTGVNGWPAGGAGPGGLPGSVDLIRFNYGNNVVTLTNEAPPVSYFQIGVDESGQFIVDHGGKLKVTGTSSCKVGNNNPSSGGTSVLGQLTVRTNGEVDISPVLQVGAGANGILTIDGGTLNQSNHLWVGCGVAGITGTVILTNGGTINMLGVNGNGMIGLGTINAVSASGGVGIINVNGGGVLNLFNIDSQGRSIQPGSVLNISGSGVVTIPGDRAAVMTNYVNAGRITAYGGTGTVVIDYNTSNPGKTTLKAVGGYVPPTEVAWNPATNASGHGFWSEDANWTGGLRPASVTKVNFNVVGATPCTVNSAAVANYIVMGDNGPGGTLIVTNGGILSCGSDNATVLGNTSNALMVVENGGAVTFGSDLWLGYYGGADGTLVMNGGTVSVSGQFGLGYSGGKGTVHINGGTLNLAHFEGGPILGDSILDVSGTGKLVINGDAQYMVNSYIGSGQITANGGAGTVVVDYNVITAGKTTVYPLGLDLAPAQAVWNPALNNPDTDGMWNVRSNWNVNMVPGNGTVVTFNIPDAIPCTVTNAAVAGYISMGNSAGPGGTLILTNGGSLTTGSDNWSAVGYSSNALMIVEKGSSASFGYHLWIGLDPGANGTLVINGGTVSVAGMFGIGWQGGQGIVQVNDGTLNLSQWHPTDSIKGASVLNLTGTGTVVITGNYAASVSNFVSNGKITANGGASLAYGFDSAVNKTTLQVAPARQAVTRTSLSGGNTILTCQTTAGHIYHVESSPSLFPAAWTSVAGTRTNAPGVSVTFSLPPSGNQMFYRTVSP